MLTAADPSPDPAAIGAAAACEALSLKERLIVRPFTNWDGLEFVKSFKTTKFRYIYKS